MHQPWLHSLELLHMFRSGRLTSSGLARRTREALGAAWELAKLAERTNVPVCEPFQGAQIGNFHVLSPERSWHQALVSQFRNTPKPQATVTSSLGLRLGTLGLAARADSATIQWVAESLNVETLGHDATTSAENESSVVLYGQLGNRRVLLTGDAGMHALTRAADYIERCGGHLRDLDVLQVPHHGSRNNVTPTVLNRIMGRVACVSASGASSTHPRRVVTNAFIRRGATVYTTERGAMRFPHNMPYRIGYGPANPVPFYNAVEG